jgi:hypothetical protein
VDILKIANMLGLNLEGIGYGLIVLVVAFIIIMIIRKTKTKKDDEILDNYIEKGIEFAISIMPANSTVNAIKLTKNALSKFVEAYTVDKQTAPDASVYKKAKALIEDIAQQKSLNVGK